MKVIDLKKNFVTKLIKWDKKENFREMPWKGEKDPYKIWLSEIILQQTRVDQGLTYYNNFVKEFPTVGELACAPEMRVFKLWEGLGYYTRCKNLIATAKYINENLNGKFPSQYDNILALKGIGPYTAAAIASFAFNLPHAVVDGNVFRVLSRYFGIEIATDSTEGKKTFSSLANELLDKKQPGVYNQSIMDFGAVICKPQLPLCTNCILNDHCTAFLKGVVQQLPIKEKSIKKTTRWFYYLIIESGAEVYIRKRTTKDIWQNLYEFILMESSESLSFENRKLVQDVIGNIEFELLQISALYKQLLTHQTIKGQFIRIKIGEPLDLKGYKKIKKTALLKLPFPKYISNFLTDKNVPLNLF